MFITRTEYEAMKATETKMKAVVRYCRDTENPDINDVLIILGAPQRVEPAEQVRHIEETAGRLIQCKEIG